MTFAEFMAAGWSYRYYRNSGEVKVVEVSDDSIATDKEVEEYLKISGS